MAFINPYEEENDLFGASEQRGIAGLSGDSAQPSSAARPAHQSKAASPGSWYNIQDFIGANKAALPGIQQGLQRRADDEIAKDRERAEGAISQMDSIQRPEARFYDPSMAQSSSYDDLYSGLTQSYQPLDVSQFDIGKSRAIDALQPGSFQSVTQFNRALMPQEAGYTSGMGRMDEALLGADPDFIESFTPGVHDMYTQQVRSPLEEAMTRTQGAEAAHQNVMDSARGGHWSGITDFLGTQKGSVHDTLADQSKLFQQLSSPDHALQELLKAAGGNRVDEWGGSLRDFATSNLEGFARMGGSGYAPNQATAALEALGHEGIDRYNTLAGMLDGLGAVDEFGRFSGQDWHAPSWQLDQKGLTDAFNRHSRGLELTDVTKQLTPLQKQLPSLQSQLAPSQKAYDSAWQDFYRAMDNLRIQEEEASKRVQSFIPDVEGAKADVLAKQKIYDDAKKKLSGIQSQHDRISNQVGSLSSRQSELQKFLGG